MKKRGGSIIAILAVLGGILCGCASNKTPAKQTSPVEVEARTDNSNQIVWVVQDWGIDMSILQQRLNTALADNGLTYEVTFRAILDYDNYQRSASNVMEKEGVDIVWLGTQQESVEWVREGQFLRLDDYLESKKYADLRAAFYDKAWQSVIVDGGIYSIPSQLAGDGLKALAYNSALFSEDLTNSLRTNIHSIDQYVAEHRNLFEENKIFWYSDINSDAAMCGFVLIDGTYVSLADGTVMCPYEAEGYVEYLRTLNGWMRDGIIADRDGKALSATSEEYYNRVAAGDYSIAVMWGYDQDMLSSTKDSILVQFPFLFVPRLGGSTAVVSTSGHIEEALEILQLIYTNKDVANRICYGEQWEKYIGEDGLIDKSGNDSLAESFIIQMIIGCFDQVIPIEGDTLTQDRYQIKWGLYGTEAELENPFLGFNSELRGSKEAVLLEAFLRENESIWQSDDFDNALQKAINDYYELGGAEVIQRLQQEVSDWINHSE